MCDSITFTGDIFLLHSHFLLCAKYSFTDVKDLSASSITAVSM